MTNEKDIPPKPPERHPGEASGTGAKRPYTTLDLKATEVPSAGAGQGKEQLDSGANPPAGRTAGPQTAAHPTQREKPDDTPSAAARIAAAAATIRQSSARSAAGAQEATAFGLGGMRGYASHLAAGVLGGLLAVVGSQLFVSRQVQPSLPSAANDTALRDLQQKLASLEQAAGERAASLEGINRTIGALRETQDKLTEQTNALQASSVDRDTTERLGRIQQQITALSAAAAADPQAAARIGQMAQMTTDLANVRQELTQNMEARLAPIAEASEAARSATQRLDREMAGIRSDATRVGQRVDVLRAGSDRVEQSLRALQADASTFNAANERLRADIEARLGNTAKAADISSAVAPVTAKIGALESSLQQVVRAESDRKTNAERIVLSLELANLKRAMDKSGGYAAELASVKKAAGDRIDLGPLERFQHEGVPTPTDLAREFRGIANAVLDADAEQPSASLVDRLWQGARTIVRVRKITHSADDTSTEAVVGRIEAAMQENRLADALAEAGKLPARAAIPAQDWVKKVEARQSVDAVLARIDTELKSSLAGTGAPSQKGDKQ